ncbi:MAG: hypothetical protein WCQ49_02075 [Candidatus Saccharibacteria bacterium]
MKEKSKKSKVKEVLIISQDSLNYSRLKEGLESNGFKVLDRPVQNGVVENVDIDFFKVDILERSKKLISSKTVIILVELILRPKEEVSNGAVYYLKNILSSISIANELNRVYPKIPLIFMESKTKDYKTMGPFFRNYKEVNPDWLLLEKPSDSDLSLNKNVFYVFIKALARKI